MDTNNESIEEFYDDVAETYGDAVTNSPIRRDCRLPAVQSLFPDIENKRILDAACGAGTDSAWLAKQGATVLGIDSSEEMIHTARERFGEYAEFRHANLEEPLEFIDDGEIDVVSSQLTLSHIRDWEPVLSEFKRVLSPEGVLVVSTDHPFRQFLLAKEGKFSDIDLYAAEKEPDVITESAQSDYYEIEQYDLGYGSDNSYVVSFYRRPISGYFQSFLNAGFQFDEIVEPVLSNEFKQENPEKYQEYLNHVPDFICLRASL